MARSNDPHDRPRRRVPDEPLPKVTAVSEAQSSAFAILRRPRAESDVIPEERWPKYEEGMIGRFGLNLALARRARSEAGNLWVIPGNGFIGLSLPESFSPASLDGGSITINATEAAAAGHTVTCGSYSRDKTMIHGLVPDGVKEVTLTATDGTTNTVAVHDNVYATVLDGFFTSARFTGPKGTVVNGPLRLAGLSSGSGGQLGIPPRRAKADGAGLTRGRSFYGGPGPAGVRHRVSDHPRDQIAED